MKPDWDKHKVAIFHLYQNEKRPLGEVMHIMTQKYGFVASTKQYKDQLKKWEMVKNLNQVDVALCLYALEDIEREGRQQVVLLRGRVMTRADIKTYLKKTKRREENLRATIQRPSEWPTHIRFGSPPSQLQTPPSSRGQHGFGSGLSPSRVPEHATPSYTTASPWNASSSPGKLLTPTSSLSHRTSLDSVVVSNAEEDSIPAEDRQHPPPETNDYMEDVDFFDQDEVSESDQARICVGIAECENFGAMVRQAIAPKPPSGAERSDPLFFSLLSTSAPLIYRQEYNAVPAAEARASESTFATAPRYDRGSLVVSHPIYLPYGRAHESAVSTEPSVSFLRECLSVCIVQGQGFLQTADALMHSAVREFQNIINRGDAYCLTALNLLIAMFESVGQRPLAKIILQKILETVSAQTESESPVTDTIRFLLGIMSGQARRSPYDTDRMWQVYRRLCELWGADSPSALVGLYHVAWTLALVDDIDARRKAWRILEQLNLKCEVTLGRYHFQTITSMTTSARVLYHLGEHWQAAHMINTAIQRLDSMYEDFHPYRLEARSRQAKLLMKLEGSHDVETILQDVVRRQAAILGVQNSRTQSTLTTLQDFLKSKGRSQEAHNLPKVLERVSKNDLFNE